MNTVLIFSYCTGDRVSQKVQVLHISQNTSFCLSRTKFGAGLDEWGCRGREFYRIIIYLDIRKVGKEHQ